jgi:hypothetical protein
MTGTVATGRARLRCAAATVALLAASCGGCSAPPGAASASNDNASNSALSNTDRAADQSDPGNRGGALRGYPGGAPPVIVPEVRGPDTVGDPGGGARTGGAPEHGTGSASATGGVGGSGGTGGAGGGETAPGGGATGGGAPPGVLLVEAGGPITTWQALQAAACRRSAGKTQCINIDYQYGDDVPTGLRQTIPLCVSVESPGSVEIRGEEFYVPEGTTVTVDVFKCPDDQTAPGNSTPPAQGSGGGVTATGTSQGKDPDLSTQGTSDNGTSNGTSSNGTSGNGTSGNGTSGNGTSGNGTTGKSDSGDGEDAPSGDDSTRGASPP